MTSTVTAAQVAGVGTVLQLPGKFGSPRFVPVIAATIPGAIGPEVMEAALTTEEAVKVGVCA